MGHGACGSSRPGAIRRHRRDHRAAPAAERLAIFGLACGLSEREREILALVAGGGSTRQIANAAFVSEHTVQDHLKAVFAKTATHSRGELVSRVLGN